jgi:threonine-phosphate decarboxylase
MLGGSPLVFVETSQARRAMSRLSSDRQHGGNVHQVAAQFGLPVHAVLDFSANVNADGLPEGARQRLIGDAYDTLLLSRYPDPTSTKLRLALSRKLGVQPESILISGGSAALIMATLQALRPRRCLCPVPAFTEYRIACEAVGCQFIPFFLEERLDFRTDVGSLAGRLRKAKCEAIILNNPHNPSGAVLTADELGELLKAAQTAKSTVILDEAFVDYSPSVSLTAQTVEFPGLVVIRSLTKFYGCPGLRVGYAITSPFLSQRLEAQLPAWPVTTFALNALAEAISDEHYALAQLQRNEHEKFQMAEGLRELGLQVFPSAANFLLLKLPSGCLSGGEIVSQLIAEHQILVRNCDSFENLEHGRFLRVAVLRNPENVRLVAAFRSVLLSNR